MTPLKNIFKKPHGFTLVELIVTITILVILSSIGFVTMTGYFAGARDGARLSDMNSIYGQLSLTFGSDGALPMPENYKTISINSGTVAYQGYVGKTILDAIKFNGGGKDPKDNTYYTYSIDKNQSLAQLMGYFEEYDTTKLTNISHILPEAYANSNINYLKRKIGLIGRKICIFIETGSLAPIQDSSTGTLDIATTNTGYTMYCDNSGIITAIGTGSTLKTAFINNSIAYSLPVVVMSQGSIAKIDTGGRYGCGLTIGGGMKCWGYNGWGNLGDNSTTTRTGAVSVYNLTSGVKDISVGEAHACALTNSGGVQCWGYNLYGQLGDNSTANRSTSAYVSGLTSGIINVSAGNYHTCALTSGGGVKCWGRNDKGQLGDGTLVNKSIPVDVSDLTSGVIAIYSGADYTCALTSGGGVKCWGVNDSGQLGDGTTITRTGAVNVSGLTSGVTTVAVGAFHTCALTSLGGMKCWGSNTYGNLGDGTTNNRLTPVDVYDLTSGVIAITAGSYDSCALTSLGGMKCWGFNSNGQLGDGTTNTRLTPVDVSGLTSGITQVSGGPNFTCALTNGGGVKCWGVNDTAQLGDGTLVAKLTPVDVLIP